MHAMLRLISYILELACSNQIRICMQMCSRKRCHYFIRSPCCIGCRICYGSALDGHCMQTYLLELVTCIFVSRLHELLTLKAGHGTGSRQLSISQTLWMIWHHMTRTAHRRLCMRWIMAPEQQLWREVDAWTDTYVVYSFCTEWQALCISRVKSSTTAVFRVGQTIALMPGCVSEPRTLMRDEHQHMPVLKYCFLHCVLVPVLCSE